MSNVTDKEYYVLKNIINDHMLEKRRARRWRLFFKFIYLFIIIIIISSIGLCCSKNFHHGKALGVVELRDEISKDNKTYDNLMTGLKAAFKDADVQAVVVRANSVGGSPVYSNMINKALYQLKKEYPKKPLYFVVEDVCASGCYYAAVAADKIYANQDSIVGSIGVISASFGASELIKKLGLESRLQVAGKYKSMGYPFQPNKPEYSLINQQLLNIVHKEFINAVRSGRKGTLVMDPDLFTGRYWLGSQALSLGLIDGLMSIDDIAREMNNIEIVDFTVAPGSFEKLRKIALSITDAGSQVMSQKALLV